MSYQGKKAIVTGGGSGMGRILAQRLAAGGATVAIIDMNEAGMAETVQSQSGITPFRCDVSSLDAVKETLAAIQAQLGEIDMLVHCAAIMPTNPALKAPEGQINKVMTINYGGTVNLISTLMPQMIAASKTAGKPHHQKDKQIVIFGSIAGYVMAPDLAAYCASKAATNAFTEILIEETRATGVHVMLVCPPTVNTPLLKQAEENSNPKNIQMLKEKNRLASPESIVDAVEKGLQKGTEILYPNAEAKFTVLFRRWAPGLLWKVIRLTNK